MSEFDLIRAILSGPKEELARTKLDGFLVSTVLTPDQGWETAILDQNGTWIVQRYGSREQAVAGHEAWTQFVREGRRAITCLGYGELLKPKTRILQARISE